MIPRYLVRSMNVRIAATVVVATLMAVGYVAIEASRIDATAPQLDPLASERAGTLARLDTTTDELVNRAVARDPFGTEQRVTLASRGSAPVPVVPVAAIRLVGTVVAGASGDFALCQVGNEPPKVVRVGQTIGSYVLRRITQGAASFDSPDGERVELRVSKTGT